MITIILSSNGSHELNGASNLKIRSMQRACMLTTAILPSVSVLITNYNGKSYLQECLRSVTALEYPRIEVVVVDNGSTDGSVSMVAAEFPNVKVVASDSNLGYAGGNNLGLRFACGEYILFLNNDATVERETVTKLIEAAAEEERIGVLGCKIYFGEGLTLQHAGGILFPWGVSRLVGCGERDTGQFDEMRDVDWVSGAALMVKRDVVDSVGPLETYFGLYKEDIDLCFRAHKADFRVVYVSAAVVHHRGSIATDTLLDAPGKYYWRQRSRIAFAIKNFGTSGCLVWLVWEMWNLAFRIISAIYRSDGRWLSALLRAYYWNVVNIRGTMGLRPKALGGRKRGKLVREPSHPADRLFSGCEESELVPRVTGVRAQTHKRNMSLHEENLSPTWGTRIQAGKRD